MSGAEEPGVVTGVVTDAEDETVEGAVCILKRQSDNEVFETTTDSDGVYRFEMVEEGLYHAFVRYTDSRGNLYNAQNKHSVRVAGPQLPDQQNLNQRYQASSLELANGDSVTSWSDDSGNGYDLSGGSPTYNADQIGGQATVSFDGTDDVLDVSFSSISQPYTIYHVVKFIQPDGVIEVSDSAQGSGGESTMRHWNDGEVAEGLELFSGSALRTGQPEQLNDFHVFSGVFDGASSIIALNGQERTTGDASGSAGGGGLNGFSLGAREDGKNSEVDISESVVYNAAHDISTISEVSDFLNFKYNGQIY